LKNILNKKIMKAIKLLPTKRFWNSLTSATALVGALLLFYGCFEKDDPEPETAYCDNLEQELKIANQEAEKFFATPTKATCAEIKRTQLNLLREMRDCPYQDKASIDQLIDFWNQYDCSIF